MMNRTTSFPTRSTTSRSVTNVPARLDIFTGRPPSERLTRLQMRTSNSAFPSLSAATADCMRFT